VLIVKSLKSHLLVRRRTAATCRDLEESIVRTDVRLELVLFFQKPASASFVP